MCKTWTAHLDLNALRPFIDMQVVYLAKSHAEVGVERPGWSRADFQIVEVDFHVDSCSSDLLPAVSFGAKGSGAS